MEVAAGGEVLSDDDRVEILKLHRSPGSGSARPQQLNEPDEAHAESHAAGEEQQKVHRAHMGSSPLGSQEANQHRNGRHGCATSRCRVHIASSRDQMIDAATLSAAYSALLRELESERFDFFDAARVATISGFLANPECGGNAGKAAGGKK